VQFRQFRLDPGNTDSVPRSKVQSSIALASRLWSPWRIATHLPSQIKEAEMCALEKRRRCCCPTAANLTRDPPCLQGTALCFADFVVQHRNGVVKASHAPWHSIHGMAEKPGSRSP
jgi:hypothetical protein